MAAEAAIPPAFCKKLSLWNATALPSMVHSPAKSVNSRSVLENTPSIRLVIVEPEFPNNELRSNALILTGANKITAIAANSNFDFIFIIYFCEVASLHLTMKT